MRNGRTGSENGTNKSKSRLQIGIDVRNKLRKSSREAVSVRYGNCRDVYLPTRERSRTSDEGNGKGESNWNQLDESCGTLLWCGKEQHKRSQSETAQCQSPALYNLAIDAIRC